MKIQGKTMLVTGAASGIGRAVCLDAASRGARLVITDLNEKGLAETVDLVRAAGGEVLFSQALDIADYGQVHHFAGMVGRDAGFVDILVNVAGVALFSRIQDMDHDMWTKVIGVNLMGVIHTIECFVPEMIRQKKGYVVNVASASGLVSLPWHAAYTASKHGVAGLSELMAVDLAKYGVGVTLVCPGAVDTPMVESVRIVGADPEKAARHRQHFRRLAKTPEAVAGDILNAVEKEKFMVTPADIRALYSLKRHAHAAYLALMRRASRVMDKALLGQQER